MKFKGIVLCLILSLLSGCATGYKAVGEDRLAEQDERMKALAEQKEEVFKTEPLMQIEQGFYLGVHTRKVADKELLPAAFDRSVVMANSQLVSLADVAARLTGMVGVPIQVSEGLVGDPTAMPFFEGTLRQFLDLIGTHYSVNWEYDFAKNEIQIFRVKTATFTVNALSGKIVVHDTITNESNAAAEAVGGGESTGDTSTQTKQRLEIRDELSIWDEVQDNVEMIVKQGSPGVQETAVSINRSSGTVVVTATPMVLAQVQAYIDGINEKLSKQVAIEVQVFNLENSKTTSLGFNLDAVYTQLSNGMTATVSGATPITAPTGAGSLSAMILESTTGKSLDRWAGSNLLLEALKTFGNASLVTSGSGITSNGQPLPIQNVNRQAYLARVSTTITSDVGTTTELEAGMVTTGFSLMALPHILDSGRVALQYSISLSSLDSLKDISSGSETIQAPEVSTRSFMQRVNMKMGSTLVLAGFEQSRARVNGGYGLTGAGKSGEDDHNMIVVAITVHDATGR